MVSRERRKPVRLLRVREIFITKRQKERARERGKRERERDREKKKREREKSTRDQKLRETFVSVQRPLVNLTPNLLTSHGDQPPPSSPEVSPSSSPQRSRRSVSLVSARSRNAIHLESCRASLPSPSLQSRTADALRRHACTHARTHARMHSRYIYVYIHIYVCESVCTCVRARPTTR